MDIGAVGIQPGGIHPASRLQQFFHTIMPLLRCMEFIPQGQHDKGGMVGQHPQNPCELCPVIRNAFLRLKSVPRIPVGQFRLHQHPQPVCRQKGSLRRTVGMETHTVDTIGLVGGQDFHPFVHSHGAIPGFRINGTVCLTAQENPSAVQYQPSLAVCAKIPDTESYALLRAERLTFVFP